MTARTAPSTRMIGNQEFPGPVEALFPVEFTIGTPETGFGFAPIGTADVPTLDLFAPAPTEEPPLPTFPTPEPAEEPADDTDAVADDDEQPEADIVIDHTPEFGTILYGSRRGDGSWDAMVGAGQRWRGFRKGSDYPEGTLYLPMSRDKPAKKYVIETSAKALRAAGFTVEVTIENAPRDHAQVIADKTERLEERVDRLAARATRQAGEAEGHFNRADQLGEQFAGGQPFQPPSHHSYKQAKNAQKKMHAAMDRGVAAAKVADHTAQQHATAARNVAITIESPAKIQRKIDTLSAEQRRIQRDLDGYTRNLGKLDDGTYHYVEEHQAATGEWRENLIERLAFVESELEYDRARLVESKASGRYPDVDPAGITKGSLVLHGGRWHYVLRVNKKTVSVLTKYTWHDKLQMEEIRANRPANEQEAAAATALIAEHAATRAADKKRREEAEVRRIAARAAREKAELTERTELLARIATHRVAAVAAAE